MRTKIMFVLTRDAAMDLFDRRRRAWLAEDLDGYLAFFADDIHFEMPRRDPIDGIDAYAALVRASLDAVRPVAFDFHALAVDGDRVLAEWTIGLELRADGRPITYRGMSSCGVVGGRIAVWREYYELPSMS